jgi:hypothetical protein
VAKVQNDRLMTRTTKKKSRVTARITADMGGARIVHRYGEACSTYRLSPIARGFLQSGEGTISLVPGQYIKPLATPGLKQQKSSFPKLWPVNTPRLCMFSVYLEPLFEHMKVKPFALRSQPACASPLEL